LHRRLGRNSSPVRRRATAPDFRGRTRRLRGGTPGNERTNVTALGELTLVDAAAAVRSGQVRSVELLEDCLATVDAHNARLNAVFWIDREGALASAEASDAAVSVGSPLGLLHGVPLAHKDMYYEAGRPSTCGSAIRRDWRPTATATVLERLTA